MNLNIILLQTDGDVTKKDCSASVYFNEQNDEIVKRKGNFFFKII